MSQTSSAAIITHPAFDAPPPSLEELIKRDLGEEAATFAMAVCDEFAVSTTSLLVIVARIIGVSDKSSEAEAARCKFNRLKIRSDSLATMYMRARVGRADAIADEIIDIVDTETDPHRAKVRMNARQWAAGKFNRLLYGDDPVIQNNNTINNVGNVDHGRVVKAELVRRLMAKAKKNSLPARGGRGSEANFLGDSDNPPHVLPSRMRAPDVIDLEVVE